MKILLVEGITDVNLVRYIYSKMSDKNCFDDFEAKKKGKIITFVNSRHESLQIINLETLLLSTLDKTNIPQLECFQQYKKCLIKDISNIEQRAIDKHEVEAYIKFSEKPRQRNQAQFSFIDNGVDTGLWDLSKDEFKPIIKFVNSIFKV